MVDYLPAALPSEQSINLIFHSLADPTRREILKRLASKELTVTEIAEPYDVSFQAISKHIKVLEQANLIGRKKNGREYIIYLEPKTFKTAAEYITFYEQFWNSKLNNLERFLKEGGNKNE